MPNGQPKSGFVFPIFPKNFGLSIKKFGLAVSADGYTILGAGDETVNRSMIPSPTTGLCRLELFAATDDPFTTSTDKALFVADNINFQFGEHQTKAEPFVMLISEHPEEFNAALRGFTGDSVHLRFTPRVSLKCRQPDPWNEGWTLGWGVYRSEPWDFRGLYETEEEADAAQVELDGDYLSAFGTNEDGTDNFITL